MSWSDIFYPGNPKRRQEVIKKYVKLTTLMEGNFKQTNDLIDVLHKYLPGRTFNKIYVNQDTTIKENCEVFIETIHEIQDYIKEKHQELADMLDPKIYEEVMNTDVFDGEFIEKMRKSIGVTIDAIGGIAALIAIPILIKTGVLLGLASKCAQIAACTAVGIVVAVVFLGIDMIASAIIGAVERDKLDESIRQLEAALEVFDPAAYEYSKTIQKVAILIELFGM